MKINGIRRKLSLAAGLLLISACGNASTTAPSHISLTTPAPTSQASTTTTINAIPTPVMTKSPNSNSGWTTYHSSSNHFSFQHPVSVVPLECGWVFIPPSHPTTCPQGDGFCCVFLAASDNHQSGSFSSISQNQSLYGPITTSPVIVDGTSGKRLAATQTSGMGSGTNQIEYDFQLPQRSYIFLGVWGQKNSPLTPNDFDKMIQSIVFDK